MKNLGGGGGVRKFFSIFSWGIKIFCLNFIGYEIFFGILEFHSDPVPDIKNDRSLTFHLLWRTYFMDRPLTLVSQSTAR